MRRKDASLIWVDLSGIELPGSDGASLWMMVDITQSKAHEARMERAALHDALTGLPNRLLLGDRLRQAIAGAERSGHVFALAYLDLNGFKQVNDNHGHDAGDEVLKAVAARLQAGLRASDTVARLGGDEFVVLQTGVGHHRDAYAGGNAHARAVDRVGRAQFLDDPAREHLRFAILPDARLQHDELVAAQAGNGILGSYRRFQTHGHLLEQRISRWVAVMVVDRLEAVEVDIVDGNVFPLAQGVGDSILKSLAQQKPVCQPCQRVVLGQLRHIMLDRVMLNR